jgi:uncharacterized protein with FMN-binding domain
VVLIVAIIKRGLAAGVTYLLIISAVLASSETIAPEDGWVRTFGGAGEDVGTSVQETKDGGYIVTGSTTSHKKNIAYSWMIKASRIGEIWLIKTDSEGNPLWERTFGGMGKDIGFMVQQTKDGGYIIAGATKPHMIGDYDIWLIKTDSEGNPEWDKTFGGRGNDWPNAIQQTADGGYIIAGGTESYGAGFNNAFLVKTPRNTNLWLIKTDSEGNIVWDRTFGGSGFDEGSSVQETDDGGYIVTGYTTSSGAGGSDIWLVKTDPRGRGLWERTFGGPREDVGFSVREAKDLGYIVTGSTESFGNGSKDVWLIKTDSNGTKEWDKTFGGPGFDEGIAVKETRDDGYIIAGYTTEHDEGALHSWLINTADKSHVWLIKTDSNGDKEWERTFGGRGNGWANAVDETTDGSYIITGAMEAHGDGSKDLLLIKARGG